MAALRAALALTTLLAAPASDFQAGATFARLNFLVAHQLAEDDDPPSWHPGDFFGDRFGAR